MMDKLISMASRVLFILAFAVLVLGLIEKFSRMAGSMLTRNWAPDRLLEIAVSLAVVVMVLLMRQVRDAIRSPLQC